MMSSGYTRPLGGDLGIVLGMMSVLVVGPVARLLPICGSHQLRSHKLGVQAVLLQKFLVASLFDHLSVVQYNDAVSVPNR